MSLNYLKDEEGAKVPVFNPGKDDFTITYDINGDRNPISYTLRSMEIDYFPAPVADHIKKHLADKLLTERGVKTNWPDEHAQIINSELTVEI